MQFIRRLFGPSSKVSDPVSVTKVSYLSDSQTNAVVIESNVTSSSLYPLIQILNMAGYMGLLVFYGMITRDSEALTRKLSISVVYMVVTPP